MRITTDEREGGFTLIELMVVVLIIGILMAIAIPTFLATRNSANGRSAQSNLRNAFTAEMSALTANQTYQASVAAMSGIEPGLSWGQFGTGTGWTAGGSNVYVESNASSSPGAEVALGALGSDGNCYWVLGIDGQAWFNTAAAGSTPTCALPATGWAGTWGGPAVATQPSTSGMSSAA